MPLPSGPNGVKRGRSFFKSNVGSNKKSGLQAFYSYQAGMRWDVPAQSLVHPVTSSGSQYVNIQSWISAEHRSLFYICIHTHYTHNTVFKTISYATSLSCMSACFPMQGARVADVTCGNGRGNWWQDDRPMLSCRHLESRNLSPSDTGSPGCRRERWFDY